MNEEEKLELLKDLLLKDEHEYATSLEAKIKVLEETINKKEELSEKVNPIIKDELENFTKEIPSTLGPTITEALKTEIKNSQDAVVEALFPIIGKMIKKYIQQEMRILSEKINKQVSNTFSFKSIKRKFKAKATGVSEADLVLQEEFKPTLEQFLVIEQGSGIVKANHSFSQNIDEDSIAGMLTAIKSFAEDAFEKQQQELQHIEYETFHIHLQNFSKYYIAVIISGSYNVIFKDDLENKLLDFAQNKINKTDLNNTNSLTKQIEAYFKHENL